MKKIEDIRTCKKLKKFFLRECDIEASLFECQEFYKTINQEIFGGIAILYIENFSEQYAELIAKIEEYYTLHS